VVDDRDLPPATRTEGEGETLDMPEGFQPFAPGQVLGERYQILEMLGRGGMGEVWQAFDLKLRVEVALKALLPDLFKDERRRDLLRQEVRAAREVMSPNVCRIFDLIEIEGRELVSMEYVDGATLLGVLQERGPLDLKEAQDIASQFLAGLEAIHKVGLIHRDIKPENIMLTRAGRVVVMDFGLARQDTEGGGSVSGTPAYMAPEQAAGQTLDPRADVYSAGVVLAEMVSPEGIKSFESRQSVWEGVRSEPARLPDSPWAPVLKKAVAKDREGRYHTAHTLTRALEDVTLRVEGAEDLHPYPGLASFTEEDAEYFFGREAEVEQMWRKFEGPARMLALVGPSGAGKTSFLRAGVIPAAHAEWAIVRCTPGTSAMASLRQALVPVLGGDTEALGALAGGDDDATISAWTRWRALHGKALLIIDQFEELFTLNPPEVQRCYAELLNRLPLASDVHVMVSMRDDFLMECNRFEVLRPVVSDLTLVDRPTGANLRRALVQPATKCGYRFEDDKLVEEMLAEVEGERGALPLLAFAAARLWDKRDRETGLLTRQAYHDIGGVAGALARHAEATLEKIGVERLPIVRELFRNLVTADGTRAIREWDELLSIFFDSRSESPEEVLRELIDARLLTSYEVREEDAEPTRRVEIIHESLLANWPRLVRWQTQDQEGAQLRDELRQSARAWNDHGRHDDRLWTGSAYREFAVWRERYPGGLTDTEDAFATAMTSLATRHRRRRRIAVAAGFSVLLVVLAVVGTLWQSSVREARRAEAQKMLALGELQIEADPTEALAWARASLEVFDTREGRLFAFRALSKGPIARAIELGGEFGLAHDTVFSPDGEWIALRGVEKLNVYHRSGGAPAFTDVFTTKGAGTIWPFFDPPGRNLGAYYAHEMRSYSVPDFAETARFQETPQIRSPLYPFQTDRGVFFVLSPENEGRIKLWRPGSALELVATTPPLGWPFLFTARIGAAGEWAAYVPRDENRHIYLKSLTDPTLPARLVHVHDTPISNIMLHSKKGLIAVRGKGSPKITVWPLDGEAETPMRTFEGRGLVWTSNDEDRIIESAMLDGNPIAFVWDLESPSGAEPLVLRWRHGSETIDGVSIDPTGRWAAAGTLGRIPFWSLPVEPPVILSGYDGTIYDPEFTPDGQALVIPVVPTNVDSGGVRLHPIVGGGPARLLLGGGNKVAVDPQGRIAVVSAGSGAVVCPLDGSEPTRLEGLPPRSWAAGVAYDPERELVAAGVFGGSDEKVIGVWNLRDGSMRELGPADDAGEAFWGGYFRLEFLRDGSLLSETREGLVRRWNLDDGSSELLFAKDCGILGVKPDGFTAVVGCLTDDGADLSAIDFSTNEVFPLEGSRLLRSRTAGATLSPQGDVIAIGLQDGTIQVRRLEGGEPHILLGHAAPVYGLDFSPDGRLLASAGQDGSVRVWPVPDLSKPPLHALPLAELLAKLDTHTNVRIVRDETSATGWKFEIGPFPGWAKVPE